MKSVGGRAAIEGVSMYIGTIAVFVGAIFIALLNQSIVAGILSLVIGVALLVFFVGKLSNVGRVPMDDWLNSIQNKDYSYAWDGTGIAVDLQNNKIFLSGYFSDKQESKSYCLSDVREWGYELHSVQKYGRDNRLASVAVETANEVITREKTGFWVSVADIDFPVWFVKFQEKKDLKIELERWMEIMQQAVNRG